MPVRPDRIGEATATAGPRTPGRSWRALRHRNYRLYFCGQSVSLLGSWTQQVALGWLVYRLTDSAALLGIVAFLAQAPQLFVAPFAGIVIDRVERKRLMLLVQFMMLIQAGFLAVSTFWGWITPLQILVASASLGILNSFDAPLRHALAALLIADPDDLPNAIALNSLIFNTARFVGPPVAGAVLALTSEAACFALNALSFLAVIAALLCIRIPHRQIVAVPFGTAMREGVEFVRKSLPVSKLLIQVALLNFLAASYVPLMPVFARDVFHGGPDTLGMLLGSAGAGALCASLKLVMRRSVRGLTGEIAGGNLLAALALIGFALSDTLWLGAGLLFLIGFGIITGNASSNTVLQTILPDVLRGRVLALYTAANLGAAAIGSLLAGILADHVGAETTELAAGVALLLASLHFRLGLEFLRMHLRPIYAALGIRHPGGPGGDTGAATRKPCIR